MKKIKLLIVDDEPLAHKVLENYCEKIDYIEIIGNCYDAVSTINFLNKEKADALLLDIQMPDLTGLELVETLAKNSPKIVFTTAYTEFALQSFDYEQVIDYLHKPIRLTRFIKAMERLNKQLILEKQFVESSPRVIETKNETDLQQNYITVKDNKVIYKILFSEIQYIQSWGNYLKIFLDEDNMQIARKTIKEIEKELPQQDFERIHKSYIVNIHKVKAIDGNQVVLDNITLPIGKSYVVKSKEKLIGFVK